jgi:hypothetical protein
VAVRRTDERLGDFVANGATVAAAGERELHVTIKTPVERSVFPRDTGDGPAPAVTRSGNGDGRTGVLVDMRRAIGVRPPPS